MNGSNSNPATNGVRSFPRPETNLAKIIGDSTYRSTFYARLKQWNPFMVAFYRIGLLPLFGMSRNVMILITRGRKSGKIRRTPIGYFRVGGLVHIFSAWGKFSSWYKNLAAHPDEIKIQIGLHQSHVKAEILDNPAEIKHTIDQFINESPKAAGYLFGWDPQIDRIDTADFSAIIKNVLVVRIIEKN